MGRRVFFGLALISLMVCSSAFAGEPPNSDSGGSNEARKSSPPGQLHRPKTIKQVLGTRYDGRSGRSLPLSSAAAYASEHSASLPIAPIPRSAPPPGNSWTGFHVGVGVGAAQP